MLIIDAHLDLAMNAMEWNRDLTLPISEIRARETGLQDRPDRSRGMVSLPALREAGAGIVVATQIARYVQPGNLLPGWFSPQQAWAHTQAQLAWYREMENIGEMVQLRTAADLDAQVSRWNNPQAKKKPIGYVLSLEGADSLVNIDYLHEAFEYGLRAIGPAHYGPGRYSPGTGEEGPLTKAGLELLKAMGKLRMILDVTHLTDAAFYQAMDIYEGPVWASHHNCRALVNDQRQLTDEQIKLLLDRGAVIGAVMDAWMLKSKWQRGVSDPRKENINLDSVVRHFDHICEIAGNADHICIGSDLDGAFGTEQAPYDMDSIADLPKLAPLLIERGYSESQVAQVMHENMLRFLRGALND